MDAENWARARAIFDQLVDVPASQWNERLDALGVVDAQLRAEVLALLDADQAALLHTDISAQAPQMLADLASDAVDAQHRSLAGTRVGAFKLLRELGRGGMGTVWLAERIDGEFQQQVAVKLIRPGWDAGEVLARFRAERQILAGLTHPNIAHLIDGGVTGDDRPWLALEYVDGVDLRAFCDRKQLDLRARLRLFLTVCAAVSHAHSHLVVHRDLKPSNLLVTATGEVKLLDFGIAKLIDADTAQVSAARVFTPEYAAPEQVRGEVVTTAVDVYALGLLLYELLTGRRPYNVSHSTPAAYERAILDQEPTRPSLAFTREHIDAGQQARPLPRELSAQRLARALRGDLDAIVLKALRKDPADRYASVADFAADIENHLRRQPVAARRGGWRYRASRYLRRHALVAGSATVVLAALGSGLLVALQQRDYARIEALKSERVLEFMVDNFRLADPGATNGAAITARALLDRGSLRVSDALQDVPLARAQLLETMGRAYAGLGELEEALKRYEPALALRRELGDPVDLASALVLRASALKNLSRDADSLQSLAEARALLPLMPRSARARAVESRILYLGGMHDFLAKRYIEAGQQWERTLAIQGAEYGATDERSIDTALMLTRVLASQGDFDKSMTILNDVIGQLRAADPPQPAQLSEALNALGAAETKRGRFDLAEAAHRESVELYKQVYGAGHWYTAIAMRNVGKALIDQQRFSEALEPLQESLRISRATLPPTHNMLAIVLKHLAIAQMTSGHCVQAKTNLEELLAIVAAKPDVRSIDRVDVAARIKTCDDELARQK